MRRTKQLIFPAFALALACSSDPPQMTTAELMDPQSCASCHAAHVAEWSGSMHAYASDDPVFLAMNARFQKEVAASGSPTSLCVSCHAPLALQFGATSDGTNMATVDAKLHGVTCFFCHTVNAVTASHNQGLALATDGIMRGPIADPAHGASHASAYSALHDLNDPTSSSMCGSCHDVQNGHGVDIERTFAEWQSSLYAQDIPSVSETCSACHMLGSTGVASTTSGAPQRRVHDHSLAAFDVAFGPFPQTDAQRTLVQQTLDASIIARLCVNQPSGPPNVTVTLDNAFVGHEFPSGASHDRRAWVELHAYASGAEVFASGTNQGDPSAWMLRDQLADAAQQPVKFLWEATSVDASTLPPAVTNVPTDPRFVHSVTHAYAPPPSADRVTMIVHASPIGVDVLDDLVDGGELASSVAASMPTFDLSGTKLEWNKANGYGCVP